ncbi:MAG: hypothetical protein CMP63_08110 [Flavobacteriales bacterium]|nr:hypothetical protein [Flavobacteriales bacterium]
MNWVPYISISIFLVSLIVYYKTKLNGKDILIAASIVLISFLSWQSALCLIALTAATTLLQKSRAKAWIGIIIHLGVLLSIYLPKENLTFFKFGLSYYAIQNIGLLLLSIRHKPQEYNFKDLLFANAFFAKFISGPILLPKEINALDHLSKFNPKNFTSGINRILFGIFKKIVLADNLHIITDTVFGGEEVEFKGITILIASILFTIEMYLNFSAYTDIALGVGKLFNVNLKENFKIPLRSSSVSEYWKKTHISLIDWLTQNFFYPISFQLRKHPKYSIVIGILVTFILSGLWHGLYAGFLVWGILNGVYLSTEHIGKKAGIKLPKSIGWLFTILFISFSNLFFVSKTWKNSLNFTQQVFTIESWNFKWETDVFAVLGNGWHLEQQFQLGMIITLILIFLILENNLEKMAKSPNFSIGFVSILTLICFLIGNINDGAEFIYMQF